MVHSKCQLALPEGAKTTNSFTGGFFRKLQAVLDTAHVHHQSACCMKAKRQTIPVSECVCAYAPCMVGLVVKTKTHNSNKINQVA
jgi:hypothetical protein